MGHKSSSKKKLRETRKKRSIYKKDRKENYSKLFSKLIFGLLVFAFFMLSTRELPFWEYEFPPILFSVFGLGFISYGYWNFHKQKQAAQWPSIKCTIQVSDIEQARHSIHHWNSLVYYTYKVEETIYTSKNISFGLPAFSSSIKAMERTKRYKENEKVKCYYNPEKPEQAVLENEILFKKPLLTGSFGLFFIVMGIVLNFL